MGKLGGLRGGTPVADRGPPVADPLGRICALPFGPQRVQEAARVEEAARATGRQRDAERASRRAQLERERDEKAAASRRLDL